MRNCISDEMATSSMGVLKAHEMTRRGSDGRLRNVGSIAIVRCALTSSGSKSEVRYQDALMFIGELPRVASRRFSNPKL